MKDILRFFERRYYAFWKGVITTLVSSIYMMHDVDGTLCKQFSEGVGMTDYILFPL